MLFEGVAWAQQQASSSAPRTGMLDQLMYGPMVPFALLMVAFYLFFLRPQTRKAAEHRNLLAKLKRNDEVVTTGGLVGRISDLSDKLVTLEIAPNVRVRVERAQIASLSTYGRPRKEKGEAAGE